MAGPAPFSTARPASNFTPLPHPAERRPESLINPVPLTAGYRRLALAGTYIRRTLCPLGGRVSGAAPRRAGAARPGPAGGRGFAASRRTAAPPAPAAVPPPGAVLAGGASGRPGRPWASR